MLKHISEALIKVLDVAVGEAIGLVGDDGAEQATVSLSFTVGRDKDERLTVAYQIKDGSKRGGDWRPNLAPRLPFAEGDDQRVSVSTPGQEPVDTTVGAMRQFSERLRRRAATGI